MVSDTEESMTYSIPMLKVDLQSLNLRIVDLN